MITAVKNQLIILAIGVLISACAGTTNPASQSSSNGKKDNDTGSPVKISGYIDAGGTVNSR